jgi:hypothetical protein
MARQSRKGKNELDIILEQLKKSYGSDSSESLEDDLMMSSPSEEDSELNALLNTIFDSNSNTYPSENDNIADEDFESSDIPLNEEETRILQDLFIKATKRIAKENEITISRKGTK